MTTERNRACRIAYRHARAGDESLARVWRGVAEQFEPLTKRQERHPDQLALVNIRPTEAVA